MANEVPKPDTNVMDMSVNCFVPVEGLTSSVSPTSQTPINFFSGGDKIGGKKIGG